MKAGIRSQIERSVMSMTAPVTNATTARDRAEALSAIEERIGILDENVDRLKDRKESRAKATVEENQYEKRLLSQFSSILSGGDAEEDEPEPEEAEAPEAEPETDDEEAS